MKNSLIAILVSLVVYVPHGLAGIPPTPIERNQFKKVSTHNEMVSYVKELTSLTKRIVADTIGRSVQGRPILLVHVQPNGNGKKIKVLLFCQQHGNEPSGKEAALELLKRIASDDKGALYPQLDLYVIPSSNPDGNESEKRANANKEDLNRNHLLLSQPETQAIHSAFSRIQPDVTLDVHEFSAYRKEFLAAGFVRAVDEQFGAPTNLNIPLSIREYALKRVFPFLEAELSKQKLRFSNYLKMDGPTDTVRPSTTSIDDGRQSFAILNSFSFILEGKNGRSFHDEIKRRSESQYAAIDAFLRFVDRNAGEIHSLVQTEKTKLVTAQNDVSVKMDYQYSGEYVTLPMKSVTTDADTFVSMKSAPTVASILSVPRPKAYYIPQSQFAVIELLQRHGVQMEKISSSRALTVEIYSVNDVKSEWMENKLFNTIVTSMRRESVTAQSGDVIVPLSQYASTLLVIALEPSSMWGLAQYDDFPSLRTVNTNYPIYRIME